ncbi:MAG: chemotaxis protein CheB [Proteobacteria bacterium]|nr:chemotaxis protein CheB [Pseudomonadota bacterium]MBU1711325.1 chemotaxis protein CheB [Pseudomonadota bacterium]
MKYNAIVIGVSAGGMEALSTIIPQLSPDLPVPVLIVQHMSPDSDSYLIERLNELSDIKVKEAEDKEKVREGVVYFAPPNYHLLVDDEGILSLSGDERVNYARPAIDVLFESAADVYCPGLIGVILTGANQDGSAGLKKIKEEGGIAIVQDPETAFVDRMPRAALEVVEADHILPLETIGAMLNTLAIIDSIVLD